MVRYQVILVYDGTQFYGFQRQGRRARTVQSVVEAALQQIGWQGQSILAAGRTDTGVHASGQVIAFDLEWRHGEEALLKALNAHLPCDVAARQACIAPSTFHPRFDALRRQYRYTILCAPMRNPLLERYCWRVWPALNLSDLQQAAAALVGAHDFAAFGAPPKAGGSTLRTVYRAEWQQQAEQLIFEVEASAFLYRMVRRMVYLQVAVAQQRIGWMAIAQSLSNPRAAEVASAPGLALPNGLTLVGVSYLPGLRSPLRERSLRNLEDDEVE